MAGWITEVPPVSACEVFRDESEQNLVQRPENTWLLLSLLLSCRLCLDQLLVHNAWSEMPRFRPPPALSTKVCPG